MKLAYVNSLSYTEASVGIASCSTHSGSHSKLDLAPDTISSLSLTVTIYPAQRLFSLNKLVQDRSVADCVMPTSNFVLTSDCSVVVCEGAVMHIQEAGRRHGHCASVSRTASIEHQLLEDESRSVSHREYAGGAPQVDDRVGIVLVVSHPGLNCRETVTGDCDTLLVGYFDALVNLETAVPGDIENTFARTVYAVNKGAYVS